MVTKRDSVVQALPDVDKRAFVASPTHAVAEAMDKINDRWGEFVITPALMLGMQDMIIDRISFGGVKELEEMYFG